MRLRLHKLLHWEYWSVNFVYTPTIFYWIWNSIRFRTIYFFKWSNPSIKNGGLYGDSKMEIYSLLPEGSFPKTLLINQYNQSNVGFMIHEQKLEFPLIVKPDIGCRGVGVKKVYSLFELDAYAKQCKENFLIQEVIEFPQEIGLFYVRLPNSENGQITGITLKKFLTIKGNGKMTIEQLLKESPRYEMQIPKLNKLIDLSEVLGENEEKCIVPFGNHNRGTLFLDGKKFISQQLQDTMNQLLKGIDGFYYGRLDIRFNSFEELERGVKFSIIELNGAKSEPTHIYDPKHSFWFAQKEIFRHQRLFIKVICQNFLEERKDRNDKNELKKAVLLSELEPKLNELIE